MNHLYIIFIGQYLVEQSNYISREKYIILYMSFIYLHTHKDVPIKSFSPNV